MKRHSRRNHPLPQTCLTARRPRTAKRRGAQDGTGGTHHSRPAGALRGRRGRPRAAGAGTAARCPHGRARRLQGRSPGPGRVLLLARLAVAAQPGGSLHVDAPAPHGRRLPRHADPHGEGAARGTRGDARLHVRVRRSSLSGRPRSSLDPLLDGRHQRRHGVGRGRAGHAPPRCARGFHRRHSAAAQELGLRLDPPGTSARHVAGAARRHGVTAVPPAARGLRRHVHAGRRAARRFATWPSSTGR